MKHILCSHSRSVTSILASAPIDKQGFSVNMESVQQRKLMPVLWFDSVVVGRIKNLLRDLKKKKKKKTDLGSRA